MPYHILVAEDEDDVLNFLVRALSRIKPGARISPARNGQEALRTFHSEPVDLLISDHRMPLMSGLELLIAVRHESQIPFIMVSADTLVGDYAREMGVTTFLDKPLSLYTLRSAVLHVLPD